MIDVRQWDIWWLDQPSARKDSFPPQPGDPSVKNRLMAVVCRDTYLAAGGRPVCVPIGSVQADPLIHIPLNAKESGVLKDCYLWCNEIYTIERRFFVKKIGRLAEPRSVAIQVALRSFLDLG